MSLGQLCQNSTKEEPVVRPRTLAVRSTLSPIACELRQLDCWPVLITSNESYAYNITTEDTHGEASSYF